MMILRKLIQLAVEFKNQGDSILVSTATITGTNKQPLTLTNVINVLWNTMLLEVTDTEPPDWIPKPPEISLVTPRRFSKAQGV